MFWPACCGGDAMDEEYALYRSMYGGDGINGNASGTCSNVQPFGSDHMPTSNLDVGTPSTTCCRKVREQRPCLCGYLKDPNLKHFLSSVGDRKVARACGVPYPTC
ncbi:hypothetical protein GH714_013611 [Hevea brasiliensis]|uniref:Bifunctional inhibitor/plant lipid transfer protein/seed storage helical domain-containing protein n=1 Tax=Hevea brasiliensis TaxID=3981 RepID=A0A6A6MMS0_HEVBR|nr:hypothetical protein GH714_013611 [Hevea brasiliensis]